MDRENLCPKNEVIFIEEGGGGNCDSSRNIYIWDNIVHNVGQSHHIYLAILLLQCFQRGNGVHTAVKSAHNNTVSVVSVLTRPVVLHAVLYTDL